MKIEQNMIQFSLGDSETGYLDLARALSAVNGKMISQTKRSDGKYKPLGFMVRVRAFSGTAAIETANCGYPTRNAVVLAGASRDAMLKSAGVSRGNLESYQKELRIKFECDQTDATSISPGASALGFGPDYANPATHPSHANAYGNTNTYDYNTLVYDDPAAPGTDISQELVLLGDKNTAATCLPVIYNWFLWRHSYTPSAAADDIADNAFSYVMQQSSTADAIIDIVEDEADEKPYDLTNFQDRTMTSFVSTEVGNPTSPVICAPLGLLKFTTGTATANSFEVEVVGVTEL